MTPPRKMLSTTAILLTGMAFASPAHAQAFPKKMTLECSELLGPECVYDQGGNLLGLFQQANIINREIGGKWHSAGYGANGFTVDLALFYALPSCTGTPMVQSGYIAADGSSVVADAPPLWAQFDGENFWAESGPAAIANPTCNICYGVVCNGNPPGVPMPYVANIAPFYPAYAPAAIVETPSLREPASSCAAAQNCITIK